jgi:hypothetical protein
MIFGDRAAVVRANLINTRIARSSEKVVADELRQKELEAWPKVASEDRFASATTANTFAADRSSGYL